jgi:hypothetical protein
MLRATVLHPVLRGIRRFSTSSHPEALGACYVASWQLPRPDLHRSADDDFSGHTMLRIGPQRGAELSTARQAPGGADSAHSSASRRR